MTHHKRWDFKLTHYPISNALAVARRSNVRFLAMAVPASSKTASLEDIYERLHQLLSRYSPPLKTSGGAVRSKKDLHLSIPKAVAIPGVYGGKPTAISLASLILQKSYVGFYFMPIYIEPALKKKLAAPLNKLLQGKTCFHVKKLDADLLEHIEAALNEGIKCYKARGWL